MFFRHAPRPDEEHGQPPAPDQNTNAATGKFGMPHAIVLTGFPVTASSLVAFTGMPVADALQLVGVSGATGAAVVLMVTGGRKAIVAIARAIAGSGV
ncbi:hypothetical protein [Streptomyces luteireticuli]|uniref:Uncharacterized protein n=1 Tax=Streptomyces luteireticuli TaxID=173858 RepID=A0ABN0Z448_9ACTN